MYLFCTEYNALKLGSWIGSIYPIYFHELWLANSACGFRSLKSFDIGGSAEPIMSRLGSLPVLVADGIGSPCIHVPDSMQLGSYRQKDVLIVDNDSYVIDFIEKDQRARLVGELFLFF